MTSTAQEAMADVLAEGGFIQNGRRSSGLIDSETARKSVNADLRYGRLLTSTTETSSVDLVYEVPNQIEGAPGTPSIYFKFLDHQPAADTFIKLRTSVWNQGRVPTLWIITPDTIRIYDSFARPQANDTEDSHLLDILARVGSQLKHLRDIEALHKGSFDSGAFWQSLYGRKIEREQRVDISMLTDLSKTVEILTTPTLIAPAKVLEASIAHALLGRAIFISYLLDRSILNSSIFKEYHYNSFKELLNDKEATYKFFRWFRNTFNGDLFPLRVGEENTVDIVHLQVIQQLFAGTDMHAYPVTQQRLWPYQFDIIPIELISSIYEMFAHNLNSKAAEERSVHYTRLGLVELVLSLAMRNITYTARVLDPACGSGVFLVEAFRRLAWLRAKEYGRPLGHDELQEILRTQIFGIDIDPDAVNVAAFSLYLALLEWEFDPQHGWFKFPHLLYTTSAATQSPNLYVQDFCNIDHAFNHMPPFVDKGFDIIVGNPPWTALKAETAPRDPDDPEHGSQWGLKYCVRNEIPDNKPDQAFLMRARDFATEKTRIAFIVCSRVFYQQEDRSWLNRFLETNTVDIVVNFSDLVGENILFGGQTSTRLPASAILFHIANPPLNHKLMYLTPRWYPNIKRQDQITITSDDIHYLSQKVVKQKPFLWKSAFRGIARDYRLLNRLQEYPSLKQVLVDAGIDELAHHGITFGQGTQKPTPGSLLGKPFFPSGSVARYGIDITNLEPFTRPTIARRSNTKSLRLPALIISRSLRNNQACIVLAEGSDNKDSLIIDQMYYGIPSSITHPDLVYRLNAIFNSRMAFYMAFMFSSGLGWGRRLIEVGDWQQIRLPGTILASDSVLWTKVLQLERWLRENWQSALEASLAHEISAKENELNQTIFQLYDLSEQERILVEDTLQYSIKPFLFRKKLPNIEAYSEPTLHELEVYAKRVCLQLDGILRYSNARIVPNIIAFGQKSPLSICQFTQNGRMENGSLTSIRVSRVAGLEEVLSMLSATLRIEVADHLSLRRNLRIYDGKSFWVIKPSEKRLWSETAALSDADAIVREHMEVSATGAAITMVLW